MNEKQTREIDLRQTAYGYAQELVLARNSNALSAAGGMGSADAKSIVAEAKIIHDYITKGK